MKKFNIPDINTKIYWDSHQTAFDFGLRQQQYLELAGSGQRIVELGCGLSPMLDHASRFEYKYGVDFSEASVEKAQRLYPEVTYLCMEVTNTGLTDDFFDAVVAGEVIEHLQDPTLLIKEMERICKPGGIMILSTPHLEFQDPEHLWEFEEEDFKKLGFSTDTIHSERFPGRSYIFAWKRKK